MAPKLYRLAALLLLRLNNIGWEAARGLMVSIVLATPSWPEPRPCDDSLFVVEADDADFGAAVCEILPQIRDQLPACGLYQHRVLTIEIVDQIDHPLGNCLAYFDCDYDLIRIAKPNRYADLAAKDAVYSQFPAEVTLRSLLSHELAHALVDQSAGSRGIDIVDQEYIASAMELELMHPEWRGVYLETSLRNAAPSVDLIDIWIFGFAPREFAANAWLHFRSPENGCGLVQQIVAGK